MMNPFESTDEPDRHIRKIWEIFFEQEVDHLHKAVEALKKYEKKEWQQVIPGTGEYPELLHFKTQKEYVREVLASQIELTADRETFVDIHDLPAGHEFFDWQKKVNGKTRNVPSHEVVEEYRTAGIIARRRRRIRFRPFRTGKPTIPKSAASDNHQKRRKQTCLSPQRNIQDSRESSPFRPLPAARFILPAASPAGGKGKFR